MDAPTSSSVPDWASTEWEIVNDDGFVYKRLRPGLEQPAVAEEAPAPDPAEEERGRREKKRSVLRKVKENYEREMGMWDILSNTLRAMEEGAKKKREERERERERVEEEREEEGEVVGGEMGGSSVLDELLLQVEAQEAIIRNVSNLCDVAEALITAQEDKSCQSFFDLPIWASPKDLMASLCDD